MTCGASSGSQNINCGSEWSTAGIAGDFDYKYLNLKIKNAYTAIHAIFVPDLITVDTFEITKLGTQVIRHSVYGT